MEKKLRILMMLHIPWRKELGAARVQVELAEELRKLGHTVDKFDFNDAFPVYNETKWSHIFPPAFAAKAKEYVLQNGHKYDVIDAHQGILPYTKNELNFTGLLVVRSVGLYEFYDRFDIYAKNKWGKDSFKQQVWKVLTAYSKYKALQNCIKSIRYADLVNVCNEDEKIYLEQTFKSQKPVVNIPFGMSEERIALYEIYKTSAEERFRKKQVVFIGNWNLRKGSRDWPAIVSTVKQQIPDVQFLFLGTGVPEDKIRTELGVTAADSWIRIIPNYTSDELPQLIKDATVGAFPSYIEGFPFAVLEKTFAGLPVVAYDVPGPREIIKQVNQSYLVPLGDTAKLSEVLIDILHYNPDTYKTLMDRCIERSHILTCKSIAKTHEDIYVQALNKH